MPYIEEPLTIWKAAKLGMLVEVKRLVAEGVSVDAKARGDITPLHETAMAGEVQVLEWLLDNGANINARTCAERGYPGAETPFYLAVQRNELEAAKLLIQRGAKVNLKSSDGTSALDIAASSGSLEMVQLLVENGASLKPRGESNPLDSATCAKRMDVVTCLVVMGASLDVKCTPFDGSLLMSAVRSKWLEGIDFLLRHKVDINQTDANGMTALHCAVLGFGSRVTNFTKGKAMVVDAPEDAIPVVKRLLEAGANTSIRDKDDFTALDWAKKMRARPIIELFERR